MESSSELSKLVLQVLFFPSYFQNDMMAFAWGAQDSLGLMAAKRVLLLLPTGAVILGLWVSILCLLTVVVRQKRIEFLTAFLSTWWDLGKSVFAFWAGFLKAIWVLLSSLYGILRVILVGLWLILQDILLVPFRTVRSVASSVSTPGLPWIAVFLTFLWCLLEAVIFTYVMTPLVLDTLSNMTGQTLTETVVRIPLFLFMLFLILGSYAVLSNWADAIKRKDVPAIVRITVIEMVAVLVEVLFLYRELVDSLMPWFAQHSKDFDLGVVGTLAVAGLAWSGIRGMTWFLFGSHGTPIILAMIQGSGLKASPTAESRQKVDAFQYTFSFFYHIKTDMDWVRQKSDELLGAFLLPPLQVLAAAINFITLLIASKHLFELPFKNVKDVMALKGMVAAAANHKKLAKKAARRTPAEGGQP